MPILADAVVETIADDEERYRQLIASGDLEQVGVYAYYKAVPYKLYLGTDRMIGNSLSTCRLLVLAKGDEFVYSCYYKVAENEYFGQRAVQLEVRQAPHLRGLARNVMRNYFLLKFDALRTDLSGTPCGRHMWQEFYKEFRKDYHFYHGFVNIDLRTSHGDNNQEAACPDRVTHIKSLKTGVAMRDELWHDNKAGNVTVIYISNKPLRGQE